MVLVRMCGCGCDDGIFGGWLCAGRAVHGAVVVVVVVGSMVISHSAGTFKVTSCRAASLSRSATSKVFNLCERPPPSLPALMQLSFVCSWSSHSQHRRGRRWRLAGCRRSTWRRGVTGGAWLIYALYEWAWTCVRRAHGVFVHGAGVAVYMWAALGAVSMGEAMRAMR